MVQPRVTPSIWACECGRKVPGSVEACRCGKKRPADVGLTGAAEWAEQRAAAKPVDKKVEGLLGAKSLLQIGSFLLVLGLFFGSRYFNRYRASREVRGAMISELSKQLGEEVATGLVDKVHWACFEPNYQMSFRRRGGSATFDEKQYSSCAFRALERDAGRIRTSGQEAARAEDGASREASQPAAETPLTAPNVARVAALSERAKPGGEKVQRIKALEELAKLGEGAQAAVPVFVLALEDPDDLVRNAALRGFRLLHPDPGVGLVAIRARFNDSSVVNQILAAGSLADLGQSEEAVTHLALFLKGRDSTWAAAELGRIGVNAKPAVPALIEMLEQRQNSTVGYAACNALAAIGRDAAAALPALRAAASDPDKSVSGSASYAIRQIEGR